MTYLKSSFLWPPCWELGQGVGRGRGGDLIKRTNQKQNYMNVSEISNVMKNESNIPPEAWRNPCRNKRKAGKHFYYLLTKTHSFEFFQCLE